MVKFEKLLTVSLLLERFIKVVYSTKINWRKSDFVYVIFGHSLCPYLSGGLQSSSSHIVISQLHAHVVVSSILFVSCIVNI